MKRGRRALAILALTGASLAAWFGVNSLVRDVQFARAAQEVENNRTQLQNTAELSNVYRQVAKVVEPSVVKIDVRKTIRGGRRLQSLIPPNMRGFIIPDGEGDNNEDDTTPSPEDDLQQIGEGSGVIMETDGSTAYILTNNHVAAGATDMRVTLWDGREIDDAKVVGTDPKSDLAVIRISADRLIPAHWGNSDYLEKGDMILAFGSPFGYVGSMTHGIVSALNRERVGIQGSDIAYENFIQVDAPINPGNSGGPLVNLKGEVVGINTAIASVTGGFAGVGFAIPSNQAKVVYTQLKDKGKIVRGYLGIGIDDVKNPKNDDAKLVLDAMEYKATEGILVFRVPTGPSSGILEPGDVITQLNGKPITDVQELRNTIAAMAPGTEAKLKVVRAGKPTDLTVKVGEQPDEPTMASAGGRRGNRPRNGDAEQEEQSNAETLGMKLSDLNDQLAERHGLGSAQSGGAIVTAVAPNSPAQQAGLRAGDLITRIGRTKIASANEANDAFAKADLSKGVVLQVTNKEGSTIVTLRAKPQR